jgi:hypothetical protein
MSKKIHYNVLSPRHTIIEEGKMLVVIEQLNTKKRK